MAYPQDYRNDPITGSTGGASRPIDDPRGDFRRDVRSDGGSERDDAASAAIERDIDRTRSRMDSTVETLADRLRPSNLISDVLDYFASDTGTRTESPQGQKIKRVARRAGKGVWHTVKENPMPSALIAGGIAWLMLKSDEEEIPRRRGMHPMDDPYYMDEYGDEYGDYYAGGYYRGEYRGPERRSRGMGRRLKHMAGEAVEGARHAAGWVAEKAGDAASAVTHAAGSAAHKVGDVAGEAAHRTGDVAGSAQQAVGDAASQTWEAARHRAALARERARQMSRAAARRTSSGYAYSRDRFESGLNENPLGMGLAALATGVLAGFLVPRTRREDRLFGQYSHELKHRAGDVASEAMHRGRMAAAREGITPETLAGQAKDLAHRVKESAGRVAEAAASKVRDVAGEVAETAKSEMSEMRHEAQDRGLTPDALKEKVKHVAEEAAEGAREEGMEQVGKTKQEQSSSMSSGVSCPPASGSSFTRGTSSGTSFTQGT